MVYEPAMVILSGLPGSGKTTFAQALVARNGATHLESDAIRRELFSVPAYLPAEHARVFRTIESRAARAIADGQDVIIDATNLVAGERLRFVRAAEAKDANIVFVRLTAPEEVLRERLAAPRAGWSQADLSVYERMRDRPRPFRTPCVVIDTRFHIGPSVDLVARLMHDRSE